MVRYADTVGLLLAGAHRPWSLTGYGAPVAATPTVTVEVLTPPASVAALTHGFRPLIHPSAGHDGGAATPDPR